MVRRQENTALTARDDLRGDERHARQCRPGQPPRSDRARAAGSEARRDDRHQRQRNARSSFEPVLGCAKLTKDASRTIPAKMFESVAVERLSLWRLTARRARPKAARQCRRSGLVSGARTRTTTSAPLRRMHQVGSARAAICQRGDDRRNIDRTDAAGLHVLICQARAGSGA